MEVSTILEGLPATLDSQEDLDLLLKHYYELPSDINDNQRFGQWVFNLYNIEHSNSYNDSNAFSAYVSLIDYLILKKQGGE